MCTLIVLHRCVPDRPLVVAANRDEFLDRPAEAVELRSFGADTIVAPLDLEAGGTWLGVNGGGVFAGLTNLRTRLDLDESVQRDLRSRGELVTMALEEASAGEAIRRFSKLAKGIYQPFQLLVADGDEAWLLVYRESGQIVQLDPGPHIVGNVVDPGIEAELGTASLGTEAQAMEAMEESKASLVDEEPRVRKRTRIRARVEKLMTERGQDYFEGLAMICREHVAPDGREGRSPFEATCVHIANRYGTRSSLLLELSTDPMANRLWTTDGPPCERSFENRSSLLRELGVRLSDRAGTEPT